MISTDFGTFLFQTEGKKLRELAESYSSPERCIVEIGSFKGLSTRWLAEGAQETGARVYAVDHFRGSPEHGKDPFIQRYGSTYLQFFYNMERHGFLEAVFPIVADSVDAAKTWDCGKIGLLFIDGDHDKIADDFSNWSPLVDQGGTIAIHDYENTMHPKVTEFINWLIEERPGTDYMDRCESMMIFRKR